MRRATKSEIKRFDLEGGDWVDLSTRATFLERRRIEAAIFKDPLGADAGRELDLVAGNMQLLMLTIKAWGGPGFCSKDEHPHDGDCTPEAITEEAIANLDETGDLILLELQRRMVQPTPGFTPPPSPPSSTAEAAESTQPDS